MTSTEPSSTTNLSIPDLFLLASTLAVTGDLSGSRKVIGERIPHHPEAGRIDLARVAICRADWLRRDGHAQAALGAFSKIINADPLARIEKHMAHGLTLSSLARASRSACQRIRLIERAIRLQEHAVAIAEETPFVASDKRIYYLVVLSEHYLRLMKERGRKQDPRIEANHERCAVLAQMPDVSGAHAKRLAWELPFDRGLYLAAAGKRNEAHDCFINMWQNVVGGQDERSKTWAALCLRGSAEKLGLQSTESRQATDYIVTNGLSALLPSDKILLKFFL